MKSEKETNFDKSLILSYSYKIIIVLDGHGLSDLKNIILPGKPDQKYILMICFEIFKDF